MTEANMFDSLLNATRNGQWNLVLASVLTIAVWASKRFVPLISGLPKEVHFLGRPVSTMALLAAGASVAASIATNLGTEGFDMKSTSAWLKAVTHGLETGLAASGAWSLLLKGWLPAETKNGAEAKAK